jgi:glutamate synthase (NADPH) small chain
VTLADLEAKHDAVLLAGGAEKPRDIPVSGRDLGGIHFAMNFLPQQNRRVSGEKLGKVLELNAKGLNVVVIGGGDTGSDCIGTSFRQGAVSVTQLEIMAAPPEKENKDMVWPNWPLKMRTSSSQAEGAKRDFAVNTKRFEGKDGRVTKLICVKVDEKFKEVPGSEFEIPADLVLLAMGFVAPETDPLFKKDEVAVDGRGNVRATDKDYATSKPKVFAAGDIRRGQSLVVWAIREGRQAAHSIDKALMGKTDLPR